jgi:hypothetical protein
MTNIETKFAHRARKILNFKKAYLQLPNTPIMMLGKIDVAKLTEFLQKLPMMKAFPSRSTGFANMSEYLTKNDLDPDSLYTSDVARQLDNLIDPISDEVRRCISRTLDHTVMIVRGVIDTIDENSCIIPHSDGFVFHKLSFRVHIPLFVTEKSIGVNFNPWTCKPYSWKMETVGGIYLFNNFEPHTVSVLDTGTRAHLIFDVSVGDLISDCDSEGGYIEAKRVLASRGDLTTDSYSPNTITHTVSNFTIRNKLSSIYAGLEPKKSLLEQASIESVAESRLWIKQLLNFELDNGNVRHI